MSTPTPRPSGRLASRQGGASPVGPIHGASSENVACRHVRRRIQPVTESPPENEPFSSASSPPYWYRAAPVPRDRSSAGPGPNRRRFQVRQGAFTIRPANHPWAPIHSCHRCPPAREATDPLVHKAIPPGTANSTRKPRSKSVSLNPFRWSRDASEKTEPARIPSSPVRILCAELVLPDASSNTSSSTKALPPPVISGKWNGGIRRPRDARNAVTTLSSATAKGAPMAPFRPPIAGSHRSTAPTSRGTMSKSTTCTASESA